MAVWNAYENPRETQKSSSCVKNMRADGFMVVKMAKSGSSCEAHSYREAHQIKWTVYTNSTTKQGRNLKKLNPSQKCPEIGKALKKKKSMEEKLKRKKLKITKSKTNKLKKKKLKKESKRTASNSKEEFLAFCSERAEKCRGKCFGKIRLKDRPMLIARCKETCNKISDECVKSLVI